MLHQHIHDSLLERSHQILHNDGLSRHPGMILVIQHRAFQAAEAEIIGRVRHLCLRENNGGGIAVFCRAVDLRAAGISESHAPGHLIKGLAGSIVPGPAQDTESPVILDHHQMGVTAGHDETHEGRLQVRVLDKICRDMAFDVVHTHQRLVRRPCHGLRRGDADEKRSHQSRAVGDAHSVHITELHARLREGAFHHLADLFDMLPGRDLRDHAPVQGVGRDLGIDHTG